METATFIVPGLTNDRGALDLSNAINSLKGVEQITVDLSAHTMTIRYDVQYADAGTLEESIRHSGYPVQGDEER